MTTRRSQIRRARTPSSTSTPRGPRRGSHSEPRVELLTVAQTAAWLGVSRSTIYRMLNSGLLPLTEFTVADDPRIHTTGQTVTLEGIGSFTLGSNGDYVFIPVANFNGTVPPASPSM